MHFDWPTDLSRQDMLDMTGLMNAVAVREHTLGFDEPLSEEDGLALMRAYANDLRRGAIDLLTARDGNQRIVGMVTLARAPLPARRHVFDMRRCVIAPDFRGQFLLEGWSHALRKLGALGCDIITLEVRGDGPVELWRRLGFREYGRLPDYARHAGQPVIGHFLYAVRAEILAHYERTGSWLHDIEPTTVRAPALSGSAAD